MAALDDLVVAEYTATQMKHSGEVLDSVLPGRVVRITRRKVRYVLFREEELLNIVDRLIDAEGTHECG